MTVATLDRATILGALDATRWVIEGNAGAAHALNVRPATLRYQMKVLGIERARATLANVSHAPAAALTVELGNLRAQARATVRAYLPGPHRAAHLRTLEARQRTVLTKLRGTLGDVAPRSDA